LCRLDRWSVGWEGLADSEQGGETVRASRSRSFGLRVVAASTLTVGAVAALPQAAQAASGTGLIAYIDSSGYLTVANQDGSGGKELVDTGTSAYAPQWSPDGNRIYYTSSEGMVFSIRPDGSALTVVASGVRNSPILVDPAGKYVIASPEATAKSGVAIAALADGSAPTSLVGTTLAGQTWWTVDPANGQVLDIAGTHLAVLAPDGSASVSLTDAVPGGIAVSPDGSRVAYLAKDAAGVQQVYVAALAYSGSGTTETISGVSGTALQLTTNDSAACGWPSWSAEGTTVSADCGTATVSVPAGGGSATPLKFTAEQDIAYQPTPGTATSAALQLNVGSPTLPVNPIPAAPPIASQTNGLMTYVLGSELVAARADGSDPHVIAIDVSHYTWAPDGSYVYYYDNVNGTIYRADPDGTHPLPVATGLVEGYYGMAVDATGTMLFYGSDDGVIYGVRTDGSDPADPAYQRAGSPFAPPGGSTYQLAVSPLDNSLVSNSWALGPDSAASELDVDARGVAISPDGTEIADVIDVSGTFDVEIHTLDNSTAGSSGRIEGQDPTPLLTIPGALSAQWTPDGADIVYTEGDAAGAATYEMPVAGGAATKLPVADTDANVQFQPVRTSTAVPAPRHVVRIWGGTALGTAIAASQYSYDAYATATGHRKADAVVLARSDAYYDALAGSTFAVAKQAPLLLTPPSGLDGSVAAEIQRVLKPGGTVYLLGGTAALSPAVANQVTALGYTPSRLAGSTMYGTAVAIAQAVSATPSRVVIATGTGYWDALSAVSYANQPGTVLVLSDGQTMPAATSTYLRSLGSIQHLTAVGGPAATMVQNVQASSQPLKVAQYPDYIFGSNADNTSTVVAADVDANIAIPTRLGIATNASWYDALAGGAAVAHGGGVLLLTSPSSLDPDDVGQIRVGLYGASEADILGGPGALPQTLVTPIADALTQDWDTSDYTSFEPGDPLPGFED
jgi:ell wall binding domain 2 (CWB2)/WD40-like Beta Propeller Repeat